MCRSPLKVSIIKPWLLQPPSKATEDILGCVGTRPSFGNVYQRGSGSVDRAARAVTVVKSVEVVYLFFLNRGTVSSVVLGAGSGLMSVH